MPQLEAKAPIAVDGVSLIIAERLRDRFSIVVLPVTRDGYHAGPARCRACK